MRVPLIMVPDRGRDWRRKGEPKTREGELSWRCWRPWERERAQGGMSGEAKLLVAPEAELAVVSLAWVAGTAVGAG